MHRGAPRTSLAELGSKHSSTQVGDQWHFGDSVGANAAYDLVERMHYLYVSVTKARNLHHNPMTGKSCDPYVEVKLGNYKGKTKYFENKSNPEWDQVFAFAKSSIQSSTLEVFVKDKDKDTVGRDDYVGKVVLDINEVPTRVPPDSPLAPQWYRLNDRRGQGKVKGEIMLAVWMGTQADEAFAEAWHSDAASIANGDGVLNIRSKVYVSPKLWYVRVNVIEAQDIQSNTKNQCPEASVKAQVGSQILRTGPCAATNPLWNEHFVFIAAEPFEEHLILTIEDRVGTSKDEVLGELVLPLSTFEKRMDHKPAVKSRWFDLEKFDFGVLESESRNEVRFASRIHLRVCLEGAYHVMDEATVYISDTRPTARQLWKPSVGALELGILSATNLLPTKGSAANAYCVARYGQKWVRTRTVVGSASPDWNEQYTWEVFDPCTVITIGVFDNCSLGGGGGSKDSRVGKLRIRLSTLESGRAYNKSFPLIVLHPSTGVRRTGQLRLALRFTCTSLANMIHLYGEPLLPKMHYVQPFTVNQLSILRRQAMGIVVGRLGRAEPPLRKEVIEYMLDVDVQLWSMRQSKANFFRVMALLSGAVGACGWFDQVCKWSSPVTTVLVHMLFLILVRCPELVLPTVFLYMVIAGIWRYRSRARGPAEVDTRLSWLEAASPDELDEEFDTFPTTRPYEVVKMRYDRLRTVAGRVQAVVGDVATQGERVQGLLSWRDSRATFLFMVFCLLAAALLYALPFKVMLMVAGLYLMRHPAFRSRMPLAPINFFRRLPSMIDGML